MTNATPTDNPAPTATAPFGGAYAGRRVLVTGASGFKGSWLVLWLERLGATVVATGLEPDADPSLFDESGLRDRVDWHAADIRSFEAIDELVRRARPEIVFHLAAQPLVRRSYREPLETFSTNVLGTAHVLEAVRRHGVPACVNVTSDKCYENVHMDSGYRETDAMGGHDPYSASKGCAELVAQSFARSYFHEGDQPLLASARAGNVIGGGDWSEDRLVPDCIRSFAKGEPVEIRNPGATRPWQHVLEPLSGYLDLGRRLLDGRREVAQGWNFGPLPEGNVSVGAVVDRVAAAWGNDALSIHRPDHEQLHEAALLQLDITKAVTRLRWRPIYDAADAIDTTVSWYRRRHEEGDGFDATDAVLEQVADYESAAAGQVDWAASRAGASLSN